MEALYKVDLKNVEQAFYKKATQLQKFRKFYDQILEQLPFSPFILHWLECLDLDFVLNQFQGGKADIVQKKKLTKEEEIQMRMAREFTELGEESGAEIKTLRF